MDTNELRDILDYNPDTGILTWKRNQARRSPRGSIAGTINQNGYREIKIKNKSFRAHRLAWQIYYGRITKMEIDHINGDRSDNRISNLREVTRNQNMANTFKHINGKLPGCYFHTRDRVWLASIKINKEIRHIGTFHSQEEAHEAYMRAYERMKHEIKQECVCGYKGNYS